VDDENGVRHEAQVVVILTHDVMERVQVVPVQHHVEHENGVLREVRAVVI